MATDLGLDTAFGAQGSSDAIQQIFERRMAMAEAQRRQQALGQTDALTRLKIQEHADEIRQRLEGQKQAEKDRADALKASNDAKAEAQARLNFPLLPRTGISGSTVQQMTGAGLPSDLFPSDPMQAPAPPAGIAAPDQPAGDQPMPGTIANSPAPTMRTFSRIPTPVERKEDTAQAAQQKLLDVFPIGSRERSLVEYEIGTGKNAPAGLEPIPKPPPQSHFSPLPQFDDAGKPLPPMAFDLNTGTARAIPGVGSSKAAPGAAQAAQYEASKKDALGSLDQLDQAIEAAKDLIGPGAGRVSSVQQMVGNADPRVQALGTKMLLAKMQVDHAATGTVRAGASPQLLSRWDNLLAQKVTPEGLKAAVQAMREILGGMGTSGGGKRVVYDMNGDPVK